MIQKKLFKWVGGKKWIKDPLIKIIKNQAANNDQIDTYVEPCVGGLGSFLSIAETLISLNIKNVYLNDVNEVLITTFKYLQTKNTSLFEEYIRIEKEYESKIPREYRDDSIKRTKEDIKKGLADANIFFKEKRAEYNSIKTEASIRRSALFIFLMQHVFNGVYRENKKRGDLNTPYNWKANVASMFVMQNIFAQYKTLFSHFNLQFSSEDIFKFLDNPNINWSKTIMYVDPPFMNEKNNELSYNQYKFDKKRQLLLLELLNKINIQNLIFSNHDFKIFRSFAEQLDLEISVHYRKSRINPLKPEEVPELLIYKKYIDENDESVSTNKE